MVFSPSSPVTPKDVTDALGLRHMSFHHFKSAGGFEGIDFDRRPNGDHVLTERTALRVAARLALQALVGARITARMTRIVDDAIENPEIDFAIYNSAGVGSAAQAPGGATLETVSRAAFENRSGWTNGRSHAEIAGSRRPGLGGVFLNLAELRARIAAAVVEAERRRNSPVRHLPAPPPVRLITAEEALAQGFTPDEIEAARRGQVVERGVVS